MCVLSWFTIAAESRKESDFKRFQITFRQNKYSKVIRKDVVTVAVHKMAALMDDIC